MRAVVKNFTVRFRDSVPVGLEPVAVAVHGDDEVWVVNHLSDSISIIKLDSDGGGRVVRTLMVGDEPRDIVFAGPGKNRAFITTAHRGQNTGRDPQTTTPGVGRADVWVFDANNLGSGLTGTPLTVVTLFTDTPRALAATADGSRVYAAGFHTGNQTTIINELSVPDGFGPDGVPGPATNFQGLKAPETGIIVKWNGTHWVDQNGRNRDDSVRLSLPDKDVFAIDATANPPKQVNSASSSYKSVGTILFNMVVNPVSGKVYVSNTDANNFDRFEGPGTFTGHSLRGHLAESRITVLSSSGSVTPRHLNKHINYDVCCAAKPNAENQASLAQPTGMEITRDGRTLYVAAFGSSKVGVFNTTELENNTFVPSSSNHIEVSGGGPSGLALDDSGRHLYVMTRFDNSISVVNTTSRHETRHISLHNPEPQSVKDGRRFLYDARSFSSHGDSACGSCHIFGDFDSLAWNLGNPDGTILRNPSARLPFPPTDGNLDPDFRPMKGPMATQSLRGMDNHGPMHWRGDRTGANDEPPDLQPNSGRFDEQIAFKKFNPAFKDLLGNDQTLTAADMQKFTDFILQVTYPPNPHRNLDNSLTAAQQAGKAKFLAPNAFFSLACQDCHTLDLNGNKQYGVARPGFFGTSGLQALETFDFDIPQPLKVPHLRNVYQKVGMFGLAPLVGEPPLFDNRDDDPSFTANTGDQMRGFGFLHDGGLDTVFRFMNATGFADITSDGGFKFGPPGDPLRRQVEDFIMAFDSNLAPIVGQQVTLSSSNGSVANPRIDLMVARANVGECDLVAKSRLLGRELGFYYNNNGTWISNRKLTPPIPTALLRDIPAVTSREMTFTCVPPGSGVRIGIDNDSDGYYDGDELVAGTDPRDASSHPVW